MSPEAREAVKLACVAMVIAALVFVLGFMTGASCVSKAHAQTPEASPALETARACFMEAGWSATDCVAIAFVMRSRARRAGCDVVDMIYAYTALKADSKRAAFVRQLPDGDEPTWNAKTNRRWARLRAVAAEALAGKRRNPAPGSDNWGSRTLKPDMRNAERAIKAGRWRVVDAQTVNAFYADVQR